MSLWDTYKQGAQVMQRYEADLAQRLAAPQVAARAPAPKNSKVTMAVIAAGLFAVFVVVPYLNKPKQVALPKGPEPKGHLRDAGQTWRALV